MMLQNVTPYLYANHKVARVEPFDRLSLGQGIETGRGDCNAYSCQEGSPQDMDTVSLMLSTAGRIGKPTQ